MTGLTIDIEHHGRCATLLLHGDLDLATKSLLRQRATVLLATHDLDQLTLDLADLKFLDSSGVGALVDLHNRAARLHVTLTLTAVPLGPARVLTIGGLADTFGLSAARTDLPGAETGQF